MGSAAYPSQHLGSSGIRGGPPQQPLKGARPSARGGHAGIGQNPLSTTSSAASQQQEQQSKSGDDKEQEDEERADPAASKDPTAEAGSAIEASHMQRHHLQQQHHPRPKPLMLSQQEMAENLEDLERVKAAAAAELSLAEVKPIQTDYHFFVQDMKDKLREAAVTEVNQSLKGKSEAFVEKNRRFLVNSNLNGRLLKEWEDLSREDREVYFQKEEEDRRRFMEDDEVASRHCFTLTARVRSPIKKIHVEGEERNKSAEEEEEKEGENKDNHGDDSNSPSEQDLNVKTSVEEEDLPTPPEVDANRSSSSPVKRPTDEPPSDAESPTKKTRPDEEEDLAVVS